MEKRLTRSSKDKVISGVCGGLGEYFKVDSAIIRIFWVFLAITNHIPVILIYIICSFVIPEESEVLYDYDDYDSYDEEKKKSTKNTALFIGFMLILIGLIFLFPNFFKIFKIIRYWPVLLILAGIYLIAKQVNK